MMPHSIGRQRAPAASWEPRPHRRPQRQAASSCCRSSLLFSTRIACRQRLDAEAASIQSRKHTCRPLELEAPSIQRCNREEAFSSSTRHSGVHVCVHDPLAPTKHKHTDTRTGAEQLEVEKQWKQTSVGSARAGLVASRRGSACGSTRRGWSSTSYACSLLQMFVALLLFSVLDSQTHERHECSSLR